MTNTTPTSNILIYQSEDGHTKIETKLENETVWLTQSQLCELFQKSKLNQKVITIEMTLLSRHIMMELILEKLVH